RNLVGAETPENLVEQNGAGDREVGAAWLETLHAQTLFEIQRDQLFADASERLCTDTAAAERRAFGKTLGGRRDGAETENRAGRADDPVEPDFRDLVEVLADFRVDVAHELTFVACLQR